MTDYESERSQNSPSWAATEAMAEKPQARRKLESFMMGSRIFVTRVDRERTSGAVACLSSIGGPELHFI